MKLLSDRPMCRGTINYILEMIRLRSRIRTSSGFRSRWRGGSLTLDPDYIRFFIFLFARTVHILAFQNVEDKT